LSDKKILLENFDVSRETLKKFEIYIDSLLEYNKDHNLIGSKEESIIWSRHVLDSLQLIPYLAEHEKIVDVGTGAGFPGMVLALSGFKVTLIESNSKKVNFLKTVSCETVTLLHDRCENIKEKYDVIMARAVTNLQDLIALTLHLSKKTSRFIFPKGKNWKKELIEAEKKYKFDVEIKKSITSLESRILILKNIKCKK
jgi:16S rRNA (guanine527-N7)-methyltransferase